VQDPDLSHQKKKIPLESYKSVYQIFMNCNKSIVQKSFKTCEHDFFLEETEHNYLRKSATQTVEHWHIPWLKAVG